MQHIAVIGAGAIGTNTALLLAQTFPQVHLSVFDAGQPVRGERTFVIGASTQASFEDYGIWAGFNKISLPLTKVRSNFANTFGGATFAATDCQTEHFAYSVAETALIKLLQPQLAKYHNITVHTPAEVTKLAHDGELTYRLDNKVATQHFDLVLATGIAPKLLTDIGFTVTTKEYDQVALVTTVADKHSSSTAYQRILPSGTSTLVPRLDGWGHILLVPPAVASELQQLDDTTYLATLHQRNWLTKELTGEVTFRGHFAPRQRILHQSQSSTRIVPLGACACTVNPIGAQELNLGLRDVLVLAQQLQTQPSLADFATQFAHRRNQDRQRIAEVTDLCAQVVRTPMPGKLAVLGLLATAVDLCPLARRTILGRSVFQSA